MEAGSVGKPLMNLAMTEKTSVALTAKLFMKYKYYVLIFFAGWRFSRI